MNLACPHCGTVYRIDPARVPENGALARCRECNDGLRIEHPGDAEPVGIVVTAEPATLPAGSTAAEAAAGTAGAEADAKARPESRTASDAQSGGAAGAEPSPEAGAPVFGPQDPETRARRLARALVSDIVVYNPDRRKESLEAGTLREDFREEILKSWDEYVEQVGEEMAKKTPYFRDALNDILAEGKQVF